jgi:VIT1/CCC1 family predicted Fe2+/Mn2+ transporter
MVNKYQVVLETEDGFLTNVVTVTAASAEEALTVAEQVIGKPPEGLRYEAKQV